MLFAIPFLFSSVADAVEPVRTIDFEGVEIHGTAPKPSVQLVQEVLRDVCPEDDSVTDPGWAECVVNLSYGDIQNLCKDLGPGTANMVVGLMNRKERYDGYDNDVIGEEMHWRGCFFNSSTGPEVENFVWRGTGNGWIVTNAPHGYRRIAASSQPSLTVFDGLEESVTIHSADATWVQLPATFAYALQRSREGSWVAIPSTTNQDEINSFITTVGFEPVYCGSERLRADEKGDCNILPRLAVVALSPTMLAVKSYLPQRVGYLVTGIFWRSETGYDIASGPDSEKSEP